MAYHIPPDLDARIQAHLASGEYINADAVLRDALDSLERRQQSLENLKAMVREADEDIAAGRVGYFNVDATMQKVVHRLASKSSER